MWVHLDLLKDEKWASSSSKKKSKEKTCTSNIVTTIPDDKAIVLPLTSPEEDVKESMEVRED